MDQLPPTDQSSNSTSNPSTVEPTSSTSPLPPPPPLPKATLPNSHLPLDLLTCLNAPNPLAFVEIDADQAKFIRSLAKLLGSHRFIHVHLVDKKFSLCTLIRIFKDQFTDSEWHNVESEFLTKCQIHELYACLHIAVQRFVRFRKRLPHVHSLSHVLDLLSTAKRILLISGAGISVSCGIPDFRSSNGIYSRLTDYELTDPTDMFDLEYFKHKPETFYSFAREIYPFNFKPSPSHMFIALLEQRGQLLRNYTQNIDNIEELAGIQRVIQCHGSFRMAKCVECGYTVPGSAIEREVFAQQVPKCPKCLPDATFPVIKPDIVFFGEQLPKLFHDTISQDLEQADLVIAIGSSLKVAPVAEILRTVPEHIPQIIINKELLKHMHSHFDVHLLGEADCVVADLCRRLEWELDHSGTKGPEILGEPVLVGENIYVYDGGVVDVAESSSSSESESEHTSTSVVPGGTSSSDSECEKDHVNQEEGLLGAHLDSTQKHGMNVGSGSDSEGGCISMDELAGLRADLDDDLALIDSVYGGGNGQGRRSKRFKKDVTIE